MSEAKTRRPKPDEKTNVHDVASFFVGRAADIHALAHRLQDGRLVTVTGPGGMGKTRLAIRFAEAQLAAYSAHGGGGVWFCDCTEARSPSGIVATVAAALGVRLPKVAGEAAVTEELGAAIARRGGVLIILDNFEHLVAEAAATVGVWLRAAPRARFLVTSRIALDLPGEEHWPLQPLTREEAVELFVRLARQVRPDISAGSEELAVVSDIVRILDGMPLAIELAASRMGVISPAQLRERLDHPLDLLVRPRAAGRHTSMRRTVLDSVHLLAPAQRDSFAACAVFRGGFTLEAAEAVLAGPTVLASLEDLARHSLVRVTPMPELGSELRFSFFETIREVAFELHAEHPEREALADRHATFYAGLADRLGPEAVIHSGEDAFLRIARELENLVVAHTRAVADAAREPSGPGARRAVAVALGLEPVLSARGLSRLRLRLLDEAILQARRSTVTDDAELALALLARGLAKRELGEMEIARADFEEGLSLAMRARSPGLAALAHARIGEIIEVAGATADAHARFVQSLELLAQAPDHPTRSLREAEAYMRIAHAHRREGRLESAERAVDDAIARYRRLRHDEGLAGALYEAAVVAMFQGRQEVALSRFDEGLHAAGRADARAVGAALTTARGGLLQEMGRLDEALAHHADAARVFRELGSRYRETSGLYYLATAYLERGDASEAEKFLVQATDRVRGVGSPRYEALIESCRAIALAELGLAGASADAMGRAERACAMCPTEPALGATVAIHRLSLAMRATHTEDDATRATSQARALADAHPSDDSRFALRILLSLAHPGPAKPRVALVVWDGGQFFRLPRAQERVDLSRRAPLGRIVHALAQRRFDAPGEALPVEEIIRAGWPGERIGAEAALNRARVALATLRKLGLRDVLVTGAGGYWLNPAVAVSFATNEQR
jgi:predicted ATPase